MTLARKRLLGVLSGLASFYVTYGLLRAAAGGHLGRTLPRGATDAVAMWLMATMVLASSSVSGIVSARVSPRPWWMAPAIVGVIEALLLVAAYGVSRAG